MSRANKCFCGTKPCITFTVVQHDIVLVALKTGVAQLVSTHYSRGPTEPSSLLRMQRMTTLQRPLIDNITL